MATHPKNTEYVRKWRLLHREQYNKRNLKDVKKYYFYKRGIKSLLSIDTTLFF